MSSVSKRGSRAGQENYGLNGVDINIVSLLLDKDLGKISTSWARSGNDGRLLVTDKLHDEFKHRCSPQDRSVSGSLLSRTLTTLGTGTLLGCLRIIRATQPQALERPRALLSSKSPPRLLILSTFLKKLLELFKNGGVSIGGGLSILTVVTEDQDRRQRYCGPRYQDQQHD